MQTLQEAEISTEAYQQAIRFLARREHSAYEIYRKLVAKEYSESEVAEAIDMLVEQNVINDSRFAGEYVRMRIDKGFGPVKIRAELRERGVDRGIIENAINDAEADWYDLASVARRKRFGKELPREWDEKAKQMRFLEARGFSADQVTNVVGDD